MMRFTITLAHDDGVGTAVTHTLDVAVERDSLAPETFGLTLAEAKAIMTKLQDAIVADQIAAHEKDARCCPGCGSARGVKGHQHARPTQLARVERSKVTPCRHSICACRCSGSASANLLTTMCAINASVGMPPSTGRSGAGATTTASSQARQA